MYASSTLRIALAPCCIALVMGGCAPVGSSSSSSSGGSPAPQPHVSVLFDPNQAPAPGYLSQWVAFPFPSDFRRTATGTIRMADFPDPDFNNTLSIFTQYAQENLDGFGANSAVHIAFDGALDVSALSTDPLVLAQPDAPMALVDVTADSPQYGTRRPLRWEYWADDGKFVAAHSLAVAPAWGAPLRQQTTYAFIMTNALHGGQDLPLTAPPLLQHLLGLAADVGALPPDVTAEQMAQLMAVYAPLRTWLASSSINPADITVATVFTTQSITSELDAIRQQMRTQQAVPQPNPEGWVALGGPSVYHATRRFRPSSRSSAQVTYHVYEGVFASPNYLKGMPPYSDGEGALNMVNGEPQVSWMEPLRFVLTVPADAPASGTCYPVVEVSHGTGGDAYTLVDDDTAGRLAAHGLAGLGIDQPLQGIRGELNQVALIFNPAASRGLVRQSVVDTFSVTRMIQGGFHVPADKSATGQDICLVNDRPLFLGHSQGGLTGSLAAAVEPDIASWMISSAGGGSVITALAPGSENNQEATIRLVLEMGPDAEALTELHPVMTLVQTLADVTDPINYGPLWTHAQGPQPDILATSGTTDVYTPVRAANALARAAAMPLVRPLVTDIWGLTAVDAPLLHNVGGATRGFVQYNTGHFAIYNLADAIHASMHFLQTSAYGPGATLVRDASGGDL